MKRCLARQKTAPTRLAAGVQLGYVTTSVISPRKLLEGKHAVHTIIPNNDSVMDAKCVRFAPGDTRSGEPAPPAGASSSSCFTSPPLPGARSDKNSRATTIIEGGKERSNSSVSFRIVAICKQHQEDSIDAKWLVSDSETRSPCQR